MPENEQGRLAALHALNIVDTPKEGFFDSLVELVARIFDVPMATISLVDKDIQWYKAHKGIEVDHTDRDVSFCTHTIMGEQPMVVEDTLEDPRFVDNRLVHENNIRFYAGAPLISREGFALGSLCVLDNKPHHPTPQQLADLSDLAKQAVEQFELKSHSCRLESQMQGLLNGPRAAGVLTEAAISETDLAWHQQQYSHIIENVQDIIFFADPDAKLTYLNPAWEFCSGLSVSDALTRPIYELASIDCISSVRTYLEEIGQGQEEITPLEFPIVHSSGSERWVQMRVNGLHSNTGEFLGFIGSLHDLTESRQAQYAQQSLHELTHVLTALSRDFVEVDVQHIDQAMATALESVGLRGDLDGIHLGLLSEDGQSYGIAHEWVRDSSRGWKSSMQGCLLSDRPWFRDKLARLETVIHSEIADLPEEAAVERGFLASHGLHSAVVIPMASRGICFGFVAYCVLDRRRVWTDEVVAVLNAVTGTICALKARIRAERALIQLRDFQLATSQLRLELALSCADMALFTLDGQGIVTFAEGKMRRALFQTEDFVVGRNAVEVIRDERVREHIYAAYLGEEREETHEVGQRFLTTRYTPVENAQGRVDGVIGIAVDVTKQRSLEQDLANARRLESIGALSAGVAHEINTPIHAIIANLEFVASAFADRSLIMSAAKRLLDQLVGEPKYEPELVAISDLERAVDLATIKTEVPIALEQSIDAARRIASIVVSLREFCHPGEDNRIESDINHLVQTAVNLSRNEWKYDCELSMDLGEDLPTVPCLANDVVRCFINLIVNATHAIHDQHSGSGILGKLLISTRQVGNMVEIAVSDDGTGIPKEIQGRVFDPFFTTKDPGKGTGQGLSLAYATVVDRHKGILTFESQFGVGTTFLVKIPVKSPIVAAA